MLLLTNTLTGKKEAFSALNGKNVGMYNCGPTVYNYAHIGNLRSYVFADILRRTLQWNDYKVNQVINITDIGHLSSDADDGEDKMTKGLKREGKPLTLAGMKELALFYEERFIDDLKELNIEIPEHLPRASEHIEEELALIRKLEEKGFVYKTSDGLYFDTTKDPEYGKLGNIKFDNTESRVAVNTEKKNQRDFALWKFNNEIGFPSPWGQGFPGWHIECSAMSMKYLGETFDIHTGGIDHIPVHHNNEIAQSQSATGKEYVKFWLHNAFVNIEGGKKMAKSEDNFLKLSTLEENNISPISYRYWLLGARYNSPMNFSLEALQGAQNAYEKLKNRLADIEDGGKVDKKILEKFTDYINDDLDTPKALALVWEILSDSKFNDTDKKATILQMDKVLGLKLGEHDRVAIPENIREFAREREIARENKDWSKSDELRKEIEKAGFEVKDTPEGQKISKK